MVGPHLVTQRQTTEFFIVHIWSQAFAASICYIVFVLKCAVLIA